MPSSPVIKRAQLSGSELLQIKWLAGSLLLLLALWPLFSLSAGLEFVLLPAIAVTALITALPRLPGRIPRWAWVLFTPFLLTVVLLDFLLSSPAVLPPMLRMVVYLALIRTLGYRSRREDFQLVLLCLFMVVIAGVLSPELLFGLQALLFTPVAVLLLFLINLTAMQEDGKLEMQENVWDEFSWRRLSRRVFSILDYRFLLLAFGVFVTLITLTLVIFLSIPRIQLQNALSFLNLRSTSSLTGFSESIEFGDVTDIIQDNSVAFRADLNFGSQEAIPSLPYWRMLALDYHHENGFMVSPSAKRQRRIVNTDRFAYPTGYIPDSMELKEETWVFYFEGGISRYLPQPGFYSRIQFQNRQVIESNPQMRTVGLTDVSAGVVFYQLDKGVDTSRIVASERERRLMLPENRHPIWSEDYASRRASKVRYPESSLMVPDDGRSRAILERIAAEISGGQALSAAEFAQRTVDYLYSRHPYSLQSSVPSGGGDRIVRWLDSTEPGHCELFAGAFALIARAAGHPVRLVTGFYGGTWNGYENYFMVRHSNAHAWCEVMSEDGWWFRVDPTPNAEMANQLASSGIAGLSIDSGWQAYLDSLRILWYRRIIRFDEEQQEELASGIKALYLELIRNVKAWMESSTKGVKEWMEQPWGADKWSHVAVYLAGAAVLVAFVRFGLLLVDRLWRSPVSEARRQRAKAGALIRRFRGRYSGLPATPPLLASGQPRTDGVAGDASVDPDEGADQNVASAQAAPALSPASASGNADWVSPERIFYKLLSIRYGPEDQWPAVENVFADARRCLRQKHSGDG